jgi:hypothetical protein
MRKFLADIAASFDACTDVVQIGCIIDVLISAKNNRLKTKNGLN